MREARYDRVCGMIRGGVSDLEILRREAGMDAMTLGVYHKIIDGTISKGGYGETVRWAVFRAAYEAETKREEFYRMLDAGAQLKDAARALGLGRLRAQDMGREWAARIGARTAREAQALRRRAARETGREEAERDGLGGVQQTQAQE